MSSVASKHALLIALGGFSIAALFVWYIKNKDKDGRKKKKGNDLITNGTAVKSATENGTKLQNGNAGAVQSSKSAQKQTEGEGFGIQCEQQSNESSKNQKKQPTSEDVELEESVVELPADEEDQTDYNAGGDSEVVQNEQSEKTEIEVLPSDQKPEEIEIGKEAEVKEEASCTRKEVAIEEECVRKEEIKLKSVPVPHIEMPSKKKMLEHEQIPEEPTPTKVLDTPLSLDITAQMSPAAFSWSEEMEKSYNEEEFRVNELSDIERSPASPARPTPGKRNQKNRKGKSAKDHHHQEKHQEKHAPVKKVQRRLTKEKSEETQIQQPKEESHKQKTVALNHHEGAAGDADRQQTIEHIDEEGYAKSNSPGMDSQNSEASSQDSGRATGGLASSLSPLDEGLTGTDDDFLPMYEFEIPNSLVGLIIGVKGKTIKELSTRTNVRMLIRQHHATEKVKTHQICQVRGKRDEINHCLQMLRRRFPSPRFPELNLQPVVPPIMPSSNFDMLSTQPTWLTLPEEIKCEIAVSSIISPSHFFIQQPTHPSFASLRHLDLYMGSLYGEHSNLPELPIPCQNGLLCAAPVGNSWFRAVTVQYYEETDEVFVKFVDYGGYSRMARHDLRQIRTDLMSLPFQSTEVMLAHVRPVDGTNNWSELAMKEFRQLCTGRVITSKLVGYSFDTRIPMVELYVSVKDKEGESHETRFDQILMDEGLARTADPSKMVRPSGTTSLMGAAPMKRPSLASQTSQTTAVC